MSAEALWRQGDLRPWFTKKIEVCTANISAAIKNEKRERAQQAEADLAGVDR
jgi:hypothetical protein